MFSPCVKDFFMTKVMKGGGKQVDETEEEITLRERMKKYLEDRNGRSQLPAMLIILVM